MAYAPGPIFPVNTTGRISNGGNGSPLGACFEAFAVQAAPRLALAKRGYKRGYPAVLFRSLRAKSSLARFVMDYLSATFLWQRNSTRPNERASTAKAKFPFVPPTLRPRGRFELPPSEEAEG